LLAADDHQQYALGTSDVQDEATGVVLGEPDRGTVPYFRNRATILLSQPSSGLHHVWILDVDVALVGSQLRPLEEKSAAPLTSGTTRKRRTIRTKEIYISLHLEEKMFSLHIYYDPFITSVQYTQNYTTCGLLLYTGCIHREFIGLKD